MCMEPSPAAAGTTTQGLTGRREHTGATREPQRLLCKKGVQPGCHWGRKHKLFLQTVWVCNNHKKRSCDLFPITEMDSRLEQNAEVPSDSPFAHSSTSASVLVAFNIRLWNKEAQLCVHSYPMNVRISNQKKIPGTAPC